MISIILSQNNVLKVFTFVILLPYLCNICCKLPLKTRNNIEQETISKCQRMNAEYVGMLTTVTSVVVVP